MVAMLMDGPEARLVARLGGPREAADYLGEVAAQLAAVANAADLPNTAAMLSACVKLARQEAGVALEGPRRPLGPEPDDAAAGQVSG